MCGGTYVPRTGGIAMQKGADIARMSADIALLEDDIARVADAKAAANKAMKLIATNYRLAVSLNTAILGAAALGTLKPIAAATLHNGTTIAILLNALLGGKGLKSKPKPKPPSSRHRPAGVAGSVR